MVRQRLNINLIQKSFSHVFFLILRGLVSALLGYLASRCYLFENFSPFSLILLAVSAELGVIPTICYLSSSFGYLLNHFNLITIKYITALTMIYVIYMVFQKSTNIIKRDTVVLSGVCCFVSGIFYLLIDRFTLFGILILLAESVLVCCCIYFINYSIKAFRRSCFLTAKEIIAAAITLVLLLLLFHDIYIFQMNAARITAIVIFFVGLYCLKTSHAAVLGSCLGIILSNVGNGGEAIFTAMIVSTLASCIFSNFSLRLSTVAFVIIYDIILFFFGKFPWDYPLFAEPLIAYACTICVPKDWIRRTLSQYIAVRSNGVAKQKSYQKIVDACKNECSIICPKAALCYDKNADELTEALESLAEKYRHTEEFGNIEEAIPFCIKPHAMARIIRNRLVFTHSEDLEDLIDQLDHVSMKMKQRIDATIRDIRFLTDQEESIKTELSKSNIIVKDINFISDERDKKRCEISFIPQSNVSYEPIIQNTLSHHFNTAIDIAFEHSDGDYIARAKERSQYNISCAALCRTKQGEQICGDQAIGFSAGKNTYYLMLADGMGSGKMAGIQSELIVDTLRKLIEGGLSVFGALKVYNSASRLHQDCTFTTIDICSVDLQQGIAEFYKAGAYDSFHLSGERMAILYGGGLPIGLSEKDKLQHKTVKLLNGDFLILASDGLTALGDHPEIIIAQCADENVRIFARNIINAVANACPDVTDDVTIMVCRIQKYSE